MTRKIDIFLKDEDDNKYHAKLDKDDVPYIVDQFLHKRFNVRGPWEIGKVYDGTAFFYGKYTVITKEEYEGKLNVD